jgi:hypothetical protein
MVAGTPLLEILRMVLAVTIETSITRKATPIRNLVHRPQGRQIKAKPHVNIAWDNGGNTSGKDRFIGQT